MTPDQIRDTGTPRERLFNEAAETIVGKPALRAFYQVMFDAFPDSHAEIERLLGDGGLLARSFRFGGTHLAEFRGVPATGRAVGILGITILGFGERRCAERWTAADFLTLMTRIGAVSPQPGEAYRPSAQA
jgi:predicted ester cyclase